MSIQRKDTIHVQETEIQRQGAEPLFQFPDDIDQRIGIPPRRVAVILPVQFVCVHKNEFIRYRSSMYKLTYQVLFILIFPNIFSYCYIFNIANAMSDVVPDISRLLFQA